MQQNHSLNNHSRLRKTGTISKEAKWKISQGLLNGAWGKKAVIKFLRNNSNYEGK